jgi:hypothetical protein
VPSGLLRGFVERSCFAMGPSTQPSLRSVLELTSSGLGEILPWSPACPAYHQTPPDTALPLGLSLITCATTVHTHLLCKAFPRQ